MGNSDLYVVRKRTAAELELLEQQLNYVSYFPVDSKYISILKTDAELSEGAVQRRGRSGWVS